MQIVKGSVMYNGKIYAEGQEQELLVDVENSGQEIDWQLLHKGGVIDEIPGTQAKSRFAGANLGQLTKAQLFEVITSENLDVENPNGYSKKDLITAIEDARAAKAEAADDEA